MQQLTRTSEGSGARIGGGILPIFRPGDDNICITAERVCFEYYFYLFLEKNVFIS